MNTARSRALWVLALALVTAAASWWLKPSVFLADRSAPVQLDTALPKQFGDWRIDPHVPVVLPSPDVEKVLNQIYNQTLARTYINSRGERVMLSIAYGGDQSDGTRAHRPEVCYPAQGFQVRANRLGQYRVGDAVLPVRQLVAQLGGRVEPISYWVMVGEHAALSGTEQKLAQLRYGMKGLIADGLLMRVSSIGGDTEPAYDLHQRFLADAFGAMAPELRSRYFELKAPGATP